MHNRATFSLDIYRDFVYDLGSDFIQRRAQEYIGNVAVDLVGQGVIEGPTDPDDAWKSIDNGSILLSEVVPHAFNRLSKYVRFPDFARAFINMAYEENSLTSWEWLSGEPIEYTRRREMSLTSNIDKRHAPRAFSALKKSLELLGYAPIIMLIDEFEQIENLKARTKQDVLNSLRHLIDMNPTNFSLIIACAPEVWEKMVSEYHAFSERIGKEVNLKPLTAETVKILIVAYLNRERTTPTRTIEPFTDESIEQIFRFGNGNTRRIITLCSQAMDLSADLECEVIDSTVLQRVILTGSPENARSSFKHQTENAFFKPSIIVQGFYRFIPNNPRRSSCGCCSMEIAGVLQFYQCSLPRFESLM